MCIAWDTLQICANVSTPLRGDMMEQLVVAIQELGANPIRSRSTVLSRSRGRHVVKPCLVELTKQQPDYTKCPQAYCLPQPWKLWSLRPLPPVRMAQVCWLPQPSKQSPRLKHGSLGRFDRFSTGWGCLYRHQTRTDPVRAWPLATT